MTSIQTCVECTDTGTSYCKRCEVSLCDTHGATHKSARKCADCGETKCEDAFAYPEYESTPSENSVCFNCTCRKHLANMLAASKKRLADCVGTSREKGVREELEKELKIIEKVMQRLGYNTAKK